MIFIYGSKPYLGVIPTPTPSNNSCVQFTHGDSQLMECILLSPVGEKITNLCTQKIVK